ncbi:hypothetical protein [Paenibacillus sp. KN14-4R]|uniref:hypothetical protein n=1 Tax=Paenibacillus sp. KN14-4R TaxID=3445773 RepID=UPI003F9F1369
MNNKHTYGDEILRQSINKYLGPLDVIEPSSDFTDQVMKQVVIASSQQEKGSNEAPGGVIQLRREMIHGAIAAAATYIFIQTGVLSKLLALNTTVLEVTHYIERISGYFTF